jgi:hypothetical protein
MVPSIWRKPSSLFRKSACNVFCAGTLSIYKQLGRIADAEIEERELGVVFEDLQVVGLGASASYQPTLGSTLNPLSIFEKINTLRHPPLRNILEGFSGIVRPGEMLRESYFNICRNAPFR